MIPVDFAIFALHMLCVHMDKCYVKSEMDYYSSDARYVLRAMQSIVSVWGSGALPNADGLWSTKEWSETQNRTCLKDRDRHVFLAEQQLSAVLG